MAQYLRYFLVYHDRRCDAACTHAPMQPQSMIKPAIKLSPGLASALQAKVMRGRSLPSPVISRAYGDSGPVQAATTRRRGHEPGKVSSNALYIRRTAQPDLSTLSCFESLVRLGLIDSPDVWL